MIEDNQMDTGQTGSTAFDVDRYRLTNENDQQWHHRKQFIQAFRYEYNEERLLCLAQCYANTKCLGCKYSEPLRSLLDQLSEKLTSSSMKRPTSLEPSDTINKRNAFTASKPSSDVAGTAFYSNTCNFVSFASPALSQPLTSPFNAVPAPSHLGDARSVDSKSTLFESAESKYTRLRTFANHLKHAIEEAQHRTGNEENDHAIEYIYQIGTQQRLFVDYRPDDLANQSHSYTAHTKSFETQTFFGQLHVDEVHICSGQGTNKKLCKRHCFQQALDLFLNEDFDVKVSSNNDRRHQYELIQKQPSHRPTDFDGDEHQDTGVFSIPSTHPMANTKINFVHALDTSTMAGRTARQQSQLERQYWQQCGRGVPRTFRPTRIHRSISPPPPVPHQSIPEPPTTVIEAVSTTPASVAATIAQMERAADQQQRSADVRHLRYPFPGKALGDQVKQTSSIPMDTAQQPICSEAARNAIDPVLLSQQRAKLAKMQPFLFSLLNTLADPNHSIDLISTEINKYHLNAEFDCADKPTTNGFHGHLIVEQIMIADGYGINKKLAKKQTYARALKSISSAKSFSLEQRDGTVWSLVCHPDNRGILVTPPSSRSLVPRADERSSRWGPPTNMSAVTSSATSAVRHLHERRVEEGSQRQRDHFAANGVCIPPPSLVEPPLAHESMGRDPSRCTSSTEEAILNNIRKLFPNTFVIFELLDFDQNIPGHYVSMLFTSMSKNKLELQFNFDHVPDGFMITYTVNGRFFMSWIASTKVAAKQMGARKAIEMLQRLYPSIKMKHLIGDPWSHEGETADVNRRLITRSQLYERKPLAAPSLIATSESAEKKEDMGSRLLKKMGWVGGGIGKDLQGIAEPIQIEDLQGRKGLGSNSLYPDQMFMRNLRRVLEQFIATNMDDGELQFANDFSSEERRSIHKEAMRLHLTSSSYGRAGERRIRITQKRNVDQLVDHLLTHGGETTRYELKAQTHPKTNFPTPAQRRYMQMAPHTSHVAAPDACDDETN